MVAMESKKISKVFCSHVRKNRKRGFRCAPGYKKDSTRFDDKENANILPEQFSIALVKESTRKIQKVPQFCNDKIFD